MFGEKSIPEGGRDYKLEPWFEFSAVRSELIPVRNAFASNIMRQNALFVMILMVMHFSRDIERCETFAEFQLYGRFSPDPATKERPDDLVDQIRANYCSERGTDDDAVQLFQAHDMFDRFNITSTSSVDVIRHGIDSLLASQLLNAWTAFEVMAADLWESALNIHPGTLAALKGNHKRLLPTSQEPAAALSIDEGKKSVPLPLVEMHEYNIGQKMGSILRSRFDFDSLSGIRQAYGAAFSEKADDIDVALRSQSLDALSALRNVIIHKVGVADKEYLKRASYLDIPKTSLGEPIMLTGEIVVPLVRQIVDTAKNLMSGVDNWLKTA